MSSKAKNIGIGIVVLLGALIAVTGLTLAKPVERSYSFVSVDHPVDMWSYGKDKWSYYFIGEGTKKDLADKARKDLIGQGFNEDKSQKVWARFSKGNQEVIVCNFGELAIRADSISTTPAAYTPSLATGAPKQWPCVYVKNGPGTAEPIELFKAKKLVHGW